MHPQVHDVIVGDEQTSTHTHTNPHERTLIMTVNRWPAFLFLLLCSNTLLSKADLMDMISEASCAARCFRQFTESVSAFEFDRIRTSELVPNLMWQSYSTLHQSLRFILVRCLLGQGQTPTIFMRWNGSAFLWGSSLIIFALLLV